MTTAREKSAVPARFERATPGFGEHGAEFSGDVAGVRTARFPLETATTDVRESGATVATDRSVSPVLAQMRHNSRRGPLPRPPLERFMAHVSPEPNTGCWLWTGAVDRQGYGRFLVGRSAQRAHRVSHELLVGPIPEGAGYHGTCGCHRCDQPSCVNPGHLFTGTHAENMADMRRKGRAHIPTATTGEA